MATVCTILLAEERDPEIRAKVSPMRAGELSLRLGANSIVMTDHQAYEIEAALCVLRMRRTYKPVAATVDVDDMIAGIAEHFDPAGDDDSLTRAARQNTPEAVP